MKNKLLTPYWITFPENNVAPLGIGVTAYSVEDAFSLIEDRGYVYHKQGQRFEIQENITFDELNSHIKVNMGPLILRGVWYPNQNTSFVSRHR